MEKCLQQLFGRTWSSFWTSHILGPLKRRRGMSPKGGVTQLGLLLIKTPVILNWEGARAERNRGRNVGNKEIILCCSPPEGCKWRCAGGGGQSSAPCLRGMLGWVLQHQIGAVETANRYVRFISLHSLVAHSLTGSPEAANGPGGHVKYVRHLEQTLFMAIISQPR